MTEQPIDGGADLLTALGQQIRAASPGAPDGAGAVTRFVVTTDGQSAADVATSAVADAIAGALGFDEAEAARAAGVTVEPLFAGAEPAAASDLGRYLLVALPLDPAATGQAYDTAYALRAVTGAARVDPDLPAAVMRPPDSELTVAFRAVSGDLPESSPPPPNADRAWHLRAMRVVEAWALAPGPGGQSKGKGAVVGHPDTGFAPHGDVDLADYDQAHDKNILDDSDDATDPLEPELERLRYPGHGTSTASVAVTLRLRETPAPAQPTPGPLAPLFAVIEALVEPIIQWLKGLFGGPPAEEAPPQPVQDGLQPSGVAPDASVIPIRCTDTVFVTLGVNLARAIRYAADQEVGVIMMSLGGLPTPWLEAAVTYAAREKGCLVVAAAGQPFPLVVAPAVYPDVAAVAATDQDDRPWHDSGRGEAVAVAAPGVDVWRASFDRHGGMVDLFLPGTGTSFAAANLGGVAALWLAHHGRDHLLATYQDHGVPLQDVFVRLLRETARTPDSWTQWEQDVYGGGIVDARALLEAPLPDAASFTPPAAWQPMSDEALLVHLGAAFLSDEAPHTVLTAAESTEAAHGMLAAALGADPDDIGPLAGEFGGELIRHLYDQLAARSETETTRASLLPGTSGIPDTPASAASAALRAAITARRDDQSQPLDG